MTSALDDVVAAGRTAWPDVDVAVTALSPLADRAFPDGLGTIAHPADLYLAWACALGHPAALRHLEREHLAQVGSFIARVDASLAVADEIRQLLRERLLVGDGRPRILDYLGRGPLGGWIRIVAVRLTIDRVRGQRDAPGVAVDELADRVASDPDPQLALVRARYREEFEAAMRIALAALTPRDRRLLRMSIVDGLGIDQIAAVYQVHRATCARWLVAIREQLTDATYRELGQRVNATRAELVSLRAALASQLEISLTALLTSM